MTTNFSQSFALKRLEPGRSKTGVKPQGSAPCLPLSLTCSYSKCHLSASSKAFQWQWTWHPPVVQCSSKFDPVYSENSFLVAKSSVALNHLQKDSSLVCVPARMESDPPRAEAGTNSGSLEKRASALNHWLISLAPQLLVLKSQDSGMFDESWKAPELQNSVSPTLNTRSSTQRITLTSWVRCSLDSYMMIEKSYICRLCVWFFLNGESR